MKTKKLRFTTISFFICLVFILFILSVNSCSVRPITSDYNYIYENPARLNLGKGKVLFYNGDYYCPLATCGKSSKVNIWINNKPAGQINYGEFFIINLENGVYDFELLHVDVVKMRSKHTLTIDDETKIIMVKPTTFTNRLKITNEYPPSFSSYRYVRTY